MRARRRVVTLAEGARVSEMPIERPLDKEIHRGGHRSDKGVVAAKRRYLYRRLDDNYQILGYYPICVDPDDADTIENGMAKRLTRKLPVPDPFLLVELRDFVKSQISMMPKVEIKDFEVWLAGTHYPENRKKQLREANKRLLAKKPDSHSFTACSSFIKREIYESYKHARLINSRSDEWKCWFGPRAKAMEGLVYDCGHFVKELTPKQRIARIKSMDRPGCLVYGTDYTAYESHFTKEIMDVLEMQLYRQLLSESDFEIVERVLAGTNVLRFRNGYEAQVAAKRMSGEMTTSLANGFSNLMVAKFIAMKSKASLDVIVEGDDALMVCDRPLRQELYAACGFTVKLTSYPDVYHAAFCKLLVTKEGHIVKDPRRVFQTFNWIDGFNSAGTKVCRELLRAKAMSLAYDCPGCPILTQFARAVLEDTDDCTPRFVVDGYHAPVPLVACEEVTNESRSLMEEVFGITLLTQRLIEECIRDRNFHKIGEYLPSDGAVLTEGENGDLATLKYNTDICHYGRRYVREVAL